MGSKAVDGRKLPSEYFTVPGRRQATAKALSERAERAEDELARFFEQSADLLCVAGMAVALCTSQSRSIRRRSGLHSNYAKPFRGTQRRALFYAIVIVSLGKSLWNRRGQWV